MQQQTKKAKKQKNPKNQRKTENYDICFFFVFCLLGFFVVAYCTQLSLSSYVQHDDGHHYGRNM